MKTYLRGVGVLDVAYLDGSPCPFDRGAYDKGQCFGLAGGRCDFQKMGGEHPSWISGYIDGRCDRFDGKLDSKDDAGRTIASTTRSLSTPCSTGLSDYLDKPQRIGTTKH